MTEPMRDAEREWRRLRRAFVAATAFATLLWLIKLVELALGLDFGRYGIHPRHASGLVGILVAPFIHSSPSHLLANTPAILILGTTLLYGYPKSAKIVIPAVYLGGGAAVWLLARDAYHVGASGVTFGVMFFVFTIGALRWDRRAIALSMIVFLMYGGMIWGVLPTDPRISFESHLCGAVIGIVLAVLLKTRDPPPPEKRYSWEDDDDEPYEWIDTRSEDFDPHREGSGQ